MKKSVAFFVTPIGNDGSDERGRSDRVLEYVLKPTIGNDYDIIRADNITSLGSINHDIIHHLYKSDLVIADLTGTNPNVMYEIGIRHAFNRPIIQIAQSGQKLPFDLGTERTIFFNLNDLRDVDAAKKKIQTTVITSRSESYSGPVQRTLALSAVYNEDRTIAEAIEELGEKIEDLESNIASMLSLELDVNASLSHGERDMLQHIYDVLAPLRPYEAERMLQTLRKITFGK